MPLAGVVMSVVSLSMMFIPPESTAFLAALVVLAFSGALFLAPLNAWMQDRYPAAKRGELQSAVNLQDCLAGIITVGIIFAFEHGAGAIGLDALTGLRYQMGFVGIACMASTFLIIRLIPADFVRVIGKTIVRAIYHIRAVNADHVPAKGGVLLLPNHVTFADSFFISTACPRPVRFVMDEAFVSKPSIRIFTSLFETMTIRRDQPLEAIREVIKALKNGDVVCLFPEGQLTRTGALCTLQRGFELIAKKAGHPLIPVWCDGAWGSIFSFERNRYFRKRPHRIDGGITVAYGDEIPSASADKESVRDGMLAASAIAIGFRFRGQGWASRMPHAHNPAAHAFRRLDGSSRRQFWVNGHQIGMVNALQRRSPIHALKHDPAVTSLVRTVRRLSRTLRRGAAPARVFHRRCRRPVDRRRAPAPSSAIHPDHPLDRVLRVRRPGVLPGRARRRLPLPLSRGGRQGDLDVDAASSGSEGQLRAAERAQGQLMGKTASRLADQNLPGRRTPGVWPRSPGTRIAAPGRMLAGRGMFPRRPGFPTGLVRRPPRIDLGIIRVETFPRYRDTPALRTPNESACLAP